jgi:hypothetical protein
MIVYGSGNADGNRHTHSNLPLVLAGNGGGTSSQGWYSAAYFVSNCCRCARTSAIASVRAT